MANEKDKNMRQRFSNEERIAAGKKESQKEILDRGSHGNPSQKDWKGFLQKQKERESADKANLDSKIAQRKQELTKENSVKQNKQPQKNKEHDKDR
jgi:hypothetical protein